MAGTFPSAWQEVAIVTIKPHNGTAREFMAITETIDISQGDYPGESIMSLAGGRIWKQSPEEDGEITLELYPVKIDDLDNGGLAQQFNGGTIDATQPLTTDTTWTAGVSRQRTGFLVAILWTDDTGASDAIASFGSAGDWVAKRFYCKNARFTSHKADFTDKNLKITATFKFPAMTKSGTAKNWAWESSNIVNSTTTFPALTYTTGDLS